MLAEVEACASEAPESSAHEVALSRAGAGRVQALCDCALALDGESCEHVWATLLACLDDARAYLWLKRGLDPESLSGLGDSGSRRSVPTVSAQRTERREVGTRASETHTPRSPAPKRTVSQTASPAPSRTPSFGVPVWRKRMASILDRAEHDRILSAAAAGANSQTRPVLVTFFLEPTDDRAWPVAIEIESRKQRVDGTWGPGRRSPLKRTELPAIEPEEVQGVLDRLAGAADWQLGRRGEIPSRFHLSPEMLEEIGPTLSDSGRLFLRPASSAPADPSRTPADPSERPAATYREPTPLAWDRGEPWETWLEVSESERGFTVEFQLRRVAERIRFADADRAFPSRFAVVENRLCRVHGPNLQTWYTAFARPLEVPAKDADEFLEQIHSLSETPRLDAPAYLAWAEITGPPRACLVLAPPGERPNELTARIEFDYSGVRIGAGLTGERIRLGDERTIILRDPDREREALVHATEFGVVPGDDDDSTSFILPGARLHAAIAGLDRLGWRIEGRDGPILRAPRVHAQVASGVEWFDLEVRIDYEGGETLALPELIRAVRRRERVVRLSGGGIGFLPEEWLERHGWLLEAGKLERGAIRFRRSQVALLDALLVAEPGTQADTIFARARENLRSFDGIVPVPAPTSFLATLRPYQEFSLGWFAFLRRLGFGGCLADDMGLGKTVMILALLDSRRGRDVGAKQTVSGKQTTGAKQTAGPLTSESAPAGASRPARPSLIVVPRSLVFNWRREAERFAPRLRIHDHTGPDRGDLRPYLDLVDVVLTTYGVLRRDIPELREIEFDYVILDESQAIKNSNTTVAKSVRLLRAAHRLALSGTPVENHLGELWSLFEFLNPGLLGSSPAFRRWMTRGEGETMAPALAPPMGPATGGDETTGTSDPRDALARAVQPFVLRRRKEQVLTELPPKEEQTLFCTLGDRQRKLYDELRRHYRARLPGGNHARVLEALLRLRQTACHPGLVDPRLAGEDSAKLDVLLERLNEVAAEGHKALVFSQFTSLLAIVRERLQIARIPYEYLDGRTRNREERVARFQREPRIPAFLISLKAGGTGLNLTAASYVFLLDPWWNPATEAQAVDRAHRMGQQRPVLACRLVAHDTVEERILELQERKQGLAEAVIRSDDAGLRSLTGEDLKLLLS